MWEEYKQELEKTGPDSTQLARLKQALAGQQRRRRRTVRPALAAAVLAAILLGTVCAAATWQGWLDPVVRYGDNGALVEEYTVAVGAALEGNRCDLTLENIVTDGSMAYCLFSARYDEDFDLDFALEYGSLGLYPLDDGGMFWRVDDGSQPGTARFVGVIGTPRYDAEPLYTPSSDGSYEFAGFSIVDSSNVYGTSLLGQEATVQVCFYDWIEKETSFGDSYQQQQRVENYYFDHVRLNDSIVLREMDYEDGTRITVTPLSISLGFTRITDDTGETTLDYYENTLERLGLTLEFTDGTRLEYDDPGITVRHQGAAVNLGWSLTLSGSPGTENAFVLSRKFHELVDPGTVAAVIIGGVRYELG